MANLFDISRSLVAAWDLAVDPETGEISEEGMAAIEQLQMDQQTKRENIACWVKNLRSDAEAIKAEAKAMTDRAKSCERKADSLMHYLAADLNGEKFQTAKVAVSWRKSVSVEIDDAELSELPEQYIRCKTVIEPDKTAIKDALKAGEIIEGCRLVEKNNINIK